MKFELAYNQMANQYVRHDRTENILSEIYLFKNFKSYVWAKS